MAPKAMKRVSTASPGGSPGKKGRTTDPVAKQCEGIAAALAASDELPNDHVAKMLAGFAPAALRTPKEERHEYQTQAVDMLGEALKMIEEAMSKHIVEQQRGSDGADEEKKARITLRAEAEKELNALREASALTEHIVSDDSGAVNAAKSELNKALAAQKKGDHDLNEVEVKKKEIETAIAESLIPLKEMGADGKLGKAGLKALEKVAKQIGVEESILKGFPRVLSKLPAERSSFDNTMLKSLEDEFQAVVEKFSKTLDEGRPGREERAAAVETAKSAYDAAVTKRDEGKAKQKELNTALRAAQTKVDDAEAKVTSFLPDMKVLMDGLDDGKKRLAEFRKGCRKDLDDLKELAKEPEPAEEAEAADAEVEAPAAEPSVEAAADVAA